MSGAPEERRIELERRLATAIRRMGDSALSARLGPILSGPDLVAVFGLLGHAKERVRLAAHECAVIRLSRIAAGVAHVFGFDEYQRDDLIQRTFIDLPAATARAASRGDAVVAPVEWVRRRAYFVARQMLREEAGSPRRDGAGLATSARTRGTRVPIDSIDRELGTDPDLVAAALDRVIERGWVEAALRTLADERPLWAEILRLHYLDGHSLNEVAAMLGRSHGTVRNDAPRARARLEAIIREHHPQLVPLEKHEEQKNALP